MDNRQFGILKELMDSPIENQPPLETVFHTCENCKWLFQIPLLRDWVCQNITTPIVYIGEIEYVKTFGCNVWEGRDVV